MNSLYVCMFSIFFYSCNSPNPISKTEEKYVATGKIKNTWNNTHIVSGVYSHISLAFDSVKKSVSGVYEYYDNWDDHYKEYLDINVFYFFGVSNSNNEIVIKSSWPGDDAFINGKITCSKGNDSGYIKVLLDSQPLVYNSLDFTKGSCVMMNIAKPRNWIEVRIVKSGKATLFNMPDSSTARKGYLVKNDIVKIISRNTDGWCYVEFNPKNEIDKSTFLWLRETDLFSVDPSKW